MSQKSQIASSPAVDHLVLRRTYIAILDLGAIKYRYVPLVAKGTTIANGGYRIVHRYVRESLSLKYFQISIPNTQLNHSLILATDDPLISMGFKKSCELIYYGAFFSFAQ